MKELTKNRQILWNNWKEPLFIWPVIWLVQFLGAGELWLCIRTGYLIFFWESWLWTLRASLIPGWGFCAILIPIQQMAIAYQTQPLSSSSRGRGRASEFWGNSQLVLGQFLQKRKKPPKESSNCEISSFLGHKDLIKEQRRRLGRSKVPFRDTTLKSIHYEYNSIMGGQGSLVPILYFIRKLSIARET
jgi:hypothetical protein